LTGGTSSSAATQGQPVSTRWPHIETNNHLHNGSNFVGHDDSKGLTEMIKEATKVTTAR
jgi:hypothetical protein